MQKNITLSAEETLIKRAREKAQAEHTTLNIRFRQWLTWYVGSTDSAADYLALMEKFTYVTPGGSFSRDEMNER